MRILFAVMSAEHYIQNGMDNLIRQTWGQDAEYGQSEFRFFCGRGETVLPYDYVRVDAPDDKENLIYKVVKMCEWAINQGYDMMLKTDIDTYVNVPLMMKENLNFDWIGAPLGKLGEMYGDTGAWSWVQGSAMWLSYYAMAIVATKAIDRMNEVREGLMRANGIISPYPHSEDLWIGQVLGQDPDISACPSSKYSNGPLTYHFAICHSTCTAEEWRSRLELWFKELHEGNFAYHESR